VHAPRDNKSDDVKGSLYEELGRVFEQLLRYDMNILLGDFNENVGREEIFKSTIGNKNRHEISNDDGVKSSELWHI
jgi:hypothetical protein